MDNLPVEIVLEIAKHSNINILYSLCLVNKNIHYILYNYLVKLTHIQSKQLYEIIEYMNPIYVKIIINPIITKTRVIYNNKTLNLDKNMSDILDRSDRSDISCRTIRITTYINSFNNSLLSNLKKKYKLCNKSNMILCHDNSLFSA